MGIDLRHMVKVHNYINDEKRPKVNIKFLMFFGLSLLAVAGLATWAILANPEPIGGGTAAATQTEYVGFGPTESLSTLSGSAVEDRLDAWKAQHPDAEIESMEPVYRNGLLVGYDVTYREPAP